MNLAYLVRDNAHDMCRDWGLNPDTPLNHLKSEFL